MALPFKALMSVAAEEQRKQVTKGEKSSACTLDVPQGKETEVYKEHRLCARPS